LSWVFLFVFFSYGVNLDHSQNLLLKQKDSCEKKNKVWERIKIIAVATTAIMALRFVLIPPPGTFCQGG